MSVINVKRIVYIVLGTIFLILGTIGIVIPLLPTTPFWLLTCWCYFRGSRTLYARVMRNRYFGEYIKGFMEDHSLSLRSKILSIGMMWVSCIATALFLSVSLWLKGGIALISIGVTIHLLSYPTRAKK